MTIAVFKKITISGLGKNKSAIVSKLQTLGIVHILPLNPKSMKNPFISSATQIDKMKSALHYLNDSPQKAIPKKIYHYFNAEKTLLDISRNQLQLRQAMDRHDFLQVRIKDLSVWGNFEMPKPGEIGDVRLWFYKIRFKDLVSLSGELVIQEIYRSNLFIYLVVLSKTEPPLSALPVPRIHTGAVALNTLKQELVEVIEMIDDLNEERRHLTRYRALLAREMDKYTDITNLESATEKISDHADFFLIQGWVPEACHAQVSSFCRMNQLALISEPISPGDMPPTLMQTYPWAMGGIELVNFYQTPGYRSIDPSFMTFFSFALFFAMILADAGYGLVIALLTLFSWRWLGRSEAGAWLRPLLVTISIFSIGYGVILGSYFGAEPAHDSMLHQFKLLDINDFSTMMKLAITVGCLHIIIANVMRAWHAKNLHAKVHSSGFVSLIIGFMILAYGIMNHAEIVTRISVVIIVISLLALVISASDLPVHDFKSLFKRMLFGLEALTHLATLFGDVLSYLRLFALGLAGASLAITFNHIAGQIAVNSLNGHGWVLGFLVLLIGQFLNFILCIMSGVIHGLRLNYIEFFKWSIKEEGYVYDPLKRKEISHE